MCMTEARAARGVDPKNRATLLEGRGVAVCMEVKDAYTAPLARSGVSLVARTVIVASCVAPARLARCLSRQAATSSSATGQIVSRQSPARRCPALPRGHLRRAGAMHRRCSADRGQQGRLQRRLHRNLQRLIRRIAISTCRYRWLPIRFRVPQRPSPPLGAIPSRSVRCCPVSTCGDYGAPLGCS